MSNATCFTEHAPFEGPPLFQNGELKFQAHHVGWIVTLSFTLVATIASFWLIAKHLQWYTKKRQQRYIIRLLLMVPIYATVSLASYIFWNHSIPITLARDSYEALVLYSFFYLLLQYLSPTTEGQKEVFRHVVLKKWVFPMGFVKYRPEDGLYFLQLMKWGVLQYCVIRPTTTLAAVILDTIGLYCEASWSPGWGHIYITVIVSISVTIAMYCLIQLYVPVAEKLSQHKPLLKLFSVKAVVFLTFWQATGLSILTMFGVVKDTNYMTAEDINTGIAAMLETFEMMCFAFLHVRAFSYHPYRAGKRHSERTPRFRSLMHALDFRDMFREIRDGSVYMGKTIRGEDAEEEVRKRIHFSKIMGRERELKGEAEPRDDWTPGDIREEDMLLESHRHGRGESRRALWLSDQGDRFGGAFEDEVERELRRRELNGEYRRSFDLDPEELEQGHRRGQTSWWRGVYDRVFQTGPDRANEGRVSPVRRRPSHLHRNRIHHRHDSQFASLDSPPPPPSVIYEYATPGDGRSNVRLSHAHRRTHDTGETEGGNDARIGHHYGHRHKTSVTGGLPHGTHADESPSKPQAPIRAIAAPQPTSTSRVGDIELLVSRNDKPLPAIGPPSTPDHNNDLLTVPSGVLRSDSLLARVFPNSTTTYTDDGHTSSAGRTNPTSSQDTLSTGPMFSPAISPSLIDHVSPVRGRRAELFSIPIVSSPKASRPSAHLTTPPLLAPPKSGPHDATPQPALPSPRYTHRRPDIVLPAPLSPARYPVESTRHGYSSPQNAHHPPTRTEVLLPPLTHSLSPVQGNLSHALPSPLRSDGRSDNRRHSVQIERPLARQQRAAKRRSVPVENIGIPQAGDATASRDGDPLGISRYNPTQQGEGSGMTPVRLTFDSSGLLDPSISGSAPRLTTPPSASPSPRPLRHAGDDISKTRRPWS